MSIKNYDTKAIFYDSYRNNCPGWNECLSFLDVKNTDSILDLGCGTGSFTQKLWELQPNNILGIDPSKEMYSIATKKLINTNIQLGNYLLDDPKLENQKFNLIFCSQVLQNLTLQLDIAKSTRLDFYQQIYQHLLPGGQLLLTTRYFPKDKDYSVMYWYADKNIIPKSVNHMNTIIGNNIDGELKECGFENVRQNISNELIYHPDYYKLNKIKDDKWRAADSFWSHISRYNELDTLIQFIDDLESKNQLSQYIEQRDLLRNRVGHIRIISAYKPR